MSNTNKAVIKSLFITALGMASVHIYSNMVTDFVIGQITSYFEE